MDIEVGRTYEHFTGRRVIVIGKAPNYANGMLQLIILEEDNTWVTYPMEEFLLPVMRKEGTIPRFKLLEKGEGFQPKNHTPVHVDVARLSSRRITKQLPTRSSLRLRRVEGVRSFKKSSTPTALYVVKS